MSLTIRTDVTAVKFLKNLNLIVAGIGSSINIYEKQSAKLIRRIKCLDGQKIHGIVLSDCGLRVVIFGGKQFSLLNIEDTDEGLVTRCEDHVACDDWIHAVTWIDNDVIALLTAHNVVQKWNLTSQAMLSHHASMDNSILYSGLLLPVKEDLIVFTGTVFSEIIIHKCGDEKALHWLKGHRGVIFSICCDPERLIIVTTSDDRSVRIWTMKNPQNHPRNSVEFWYNIQIHCSHEVYGHAARVMRSVITKEYIISCGEDAGICFWSFDGKLIRKIYHQISTIWSLDVDKEHIVTGGGDSGVMLHPLSAASDYYQKDILKTDGGVKKIQFTARNNIVMVNDNDELFYYDVKTNVKTAHKLHQNSTYKVLSLSCCKQIVAVADMEGHLNVFVENCKEVPTLLMVLKTRIDVDKLMSLHWAGNRHLVVCSHEGDITVLAAKGIEIEEYCKFILPSCRERYITAAAMNPINNVFIIGDRCGNVHCFVRGQSSPVKTFKKVHGSYGATSIKLKNNVVITTGRIGSISHHILEENLAESRFLMEKKVEFQWVEKFLDRDENIVCGFQEKKFVVYNVKTNSKVLDVQCGGGHRPWDAIRYIERIGDKFEEFIRLIYFQNGNVYLVTFQLSKIVPKTIVNGSHSKIIHCLQTYKCDIEKSMTFYISGGEDTTVRISSVNTEFEFQDEYVFKQLSNVRCLKVFPMTDNRILVVSAGGRAQICINMFKFEKIDGKTTISCEQLLDFMLKGDDEERNRFKNSRVQKYDFNPETRIMDIDAMKIDSNQFIFFIGCSDTLLRIYEFEINKNDIKFNHLKEIEYHKTCILKTLHIKFLNKDLLITTTTRGKIAFWNVIKNIDEFDVEPFDNSLNLNNSGTNSIDYKIFKDKLVIAIGGEDNAISIFLLKIEPKQEILNLTTDDETKDLTIESPEQKRKKMTIKIIDHVTQDRLHCSQITGLLLLDDVMISTSIDQRVTVCKWHIDENVIKCSFLRQVYSDVADIAGLNLLEFSSDSATVCVFGKGFEVLRVDLSDTK